MISYKQDYIIFAKDNNGLPNLHFIQQFSFYLCNIL